ncbi:MAG: hypothetical protein ACRDWV_07795 [Acidimicrobiales bacterium]
MTITDYLISGALLALVFRQIHGRRLTLFNLLWPLGLVTWAAVTYLHGIPTSGNNLVLVMLGTGVGLSLGLGCALLTSVRPGPDGVPFAKAGAAAATLWILGVGARLAFQLYATNGGGPAIGHFSAANGISIAAWAAALILMALAEVIGRSAVLAVRAYGFRRGGAAGRQSARQGGWLSGWQSQATGAIMGVRDRRY